MSVELERARTSGLACVQPVEASIVEWHLCFGSGRAGDQERVQLMCGSYRKLRQMVFEPDPFFKVGRDECKDQARRAVCPATLWQFRAEMERVEDNG